MKLHLTVFEPSGLGSTACAALVSMTTALPGGQASRSTPIGSPVTGCGTAASAAAASSVMLSKLWLSGTITLDSSSTSRR